MSLEAKKKQTNKEKLSEKALIYLLSKKGSAKEKIYENKIHDVFDEKFKSKAKSQVLEKVLKSELLKKSIKEFNRYNVATKKFPKMREINNKFESEKKRLIKEETERIEEAFKRKKQERVKKASELMIKEINEKLKARRSLDKFIYKKDKVQNKKENKKRAA
jgi:hypothetical protein